MSVFKPLQTRVPSMLLPRLMFMAAFTVMGYIKSPGDGCK